MAIAGPLRANMGAAIAPRAITSMRSCFFNPIYTATATATRRRGYTRNAYRYTAIEPCIGWENKVPPTSVMQ